MIKQNFSIWDGVYKSFNEAGGDLDFFDSKYWLGKQVGIIEKALKIYSEHGFITKDYPLPLIISMMLDCKSKLKVLDFGGGMGLQYLEVLSKIPNVENKIEYHVVDGESSINARPRQMNHFPNLKFYSSLEKLTTKIDIVHIGSTLQYIEDWGGVLKYINQQFNPEYFVLSDLLAGNIPTFVSHQCHFDKKIPIKMAGMSDVEVFFNKNNYNKIYHSKFCASLLDANKLPNDALPEAYRLDHSLNVVYKRN
ncbi:MAG: methyltransferase, TIGR04325 family [Francisellaceae bacterium]|nr:methyltransferase, TIGR04325 family [Francisellaceae bacterium]MBT6539566.1 methyltransferase, TIGR04325 family [Francisellaceae bacterium]